VARRRTSRSDVGPRNRVGAARLAAGALDHRMTNTMPKILLTLLALVLLTGAALAQQRTFYDSRGNVVGRSSANSSGTTTNYDARGKLISRESTSGNTTTIYDASGRNIGRVTTSPTSAPSGGHR
jgi:YD repeat-containing protein